MAVIGKCFCLTIETGGVIIATWNAVQMLFVIFALLTNIPYIRHLDGVYIAVGFVILIIAVAVICISVLSMKGIETRNHKSILPMLIWLIIALIVQAIISGVILMFLFSDARFQRAPRHILLSLIVIFTAVAVLSAFVFNSLFYLFKDESRHGRNGQINQHQQPFLQTKVVDNP